MWDALQCWGYCRPTALVTENPQSPPCVTFGYERAIMCGEFYMTYHIDRSQAGASVCCRSQRTLLE